MRERTQRHRNVASESRVLRVRAGFSRRHELPSFNRWTRRLATRLDARLPSPVDVPDETRRRGELVNMYQIAEGILGGRGPRILQLMSATPGEGTSTVARELARTVAEIIGRRVLLLKIASLGTAGGGCCLDPVLGGDMPFKVVVSRAAAGSYMTAEIGAVKQSVFHLFDAQCIDNLFQQMLSLVEVVIIDAPPALTEFTGLVLARPVDGTILVVEAERTRVPIVNRARRLIEANGGRILGVVLNKQRQYIPRLFNRWG